MKKIVTLFLAAVLIAVMTGCGQKSELDSALKGLSGLAALADNLEGSPSEEQSGNQYDLYNDVYETLWDFVEAKVGAHNTAVEEENPENYWSDGQYISLLYMPFFSFDATLLSCIDESDNGATQLALSFLLDNPKVEKTSGGWKISYTSEDYDSGAKYDAYIEYDCDKSRNAFRCRSYNNKNGSYEMSTFVEFIPLGNDRYLLYDKSDRAIVTYKNGEITELYHANSIAVSSYSDSYEGDLRYNSLEKFDPYPSGDKVSEQWILDDTDMKYCLTYKDGKMIYKTRDYDAVYNDNYDQTGITWGEFSTIELKG